MFHYNLHLLAILIAKLHALSIKRGLECHLDNAFYSLHLLSIDL